MINQMPQNSTSNRYPLFLSRGAEIGDLSIFVRNDHLAARS